MNPITKLIQTRRRNKAIKIMRGLDTKELTSLVRETISDWGEENRDVFVRGLLPPKTHLSKNPQRKRKEGEA